MKIKSDKMLKKLLLGMFFAFFLTSCHSNYLNIEIKTDGSVAYNKDSTAFVFIARTSLYSMPVGIAKFPDGGKSKNEYLDFSLYLFDIKHKKLTHLISLNEFYLGSAYRWLSISQINLKLKDSLLFYKLIKPYDYNIKYIDEKRYPNFLKDISKTYSINIRTHKKSVVDTTEYKHIFSDKRKKLNYYVDKSYFSDVKYSDWGINLKELCPQSKKMYIKYIINREGNESMRKAIFEQISSVFTKKDCDFILDKMEKQSKILFNDFNKLDQQKDPYRRSIRKDKYDNYITYKLEIENKLLNLNQIKENKK